MIKFGEVRSFVEVVDLMRKKQKEFQLHKAYNEMVDAKYWEGQVDNLLLQLQKAIAVTEREKKIKAQPTLC